MLKFAIIKFISDKRFRVILEGEDDELRDELIKRVNKISGQDLTEAIKTAFEEYKTEFKERTIQLK
jgi:hypothetical protein